MKQFHFHSSRDHLRVVTWDRMSGGDQQPKSIPGRSIPLERACTSALDSKQIKSVPCKKRMQPTNAADLTPRSGGSPAPMCDTQWTFRDMPSPGRIVISLENREAQI